jgi:DNA-damage-inducible protein J
MNTTLNIRIEKSIKTKAAKTLADLGLDMSTAIKMYLYQIVAKKGIPFRVVTENGYTFDEEMQMLRDSIDTKSHIKFKNVPALMKYLDK